MNETDEEVTIDLVALFDKRIAQRQATRELQERRLKIVYSELVAFIAARKLSYNCSLKCDRVVVSPKFGLAPHIIVTSTEKSHYRLEFEPKPACGTTMTSSNCADAILAFIVKYLADKH